MYFTSIYCEVIAFIDPDANGLSPSKQIKVQTRGPADKSGVKPGRKKLYVSNAESNG